MDRAGASSVSWFASRRVALPPREAGREHAQAHASPINESRVGHLRLCRPGELACSAKMCQGKGPQNEMNMLIGWCNTSRFVLDIEVFCKGNLDIEFSQKHLYIFICMQCRSSPLPVSRSQVIISKHKKELFTTSTLFEHYALTFSFSTIQQLTLPLRTSVICYFTCN